MIEKMELMNLVGHMNQLDNIMRDLVLMGDVHPVDAMQEINDSNFTLCMLEENVDEIVNMCVINPYEPKSNYKLIDKKLDYLMGRLEISRSIKNVKLSEPYAFEDVVNNVEVIYDKFNNLSKEMDQLQEEYKKLEALKVLKLIDEVEVNLKELKKMTYFEYRIGFLKKEDRIKLSMNYENISAAVLHIGTQAGHEVYLVVAPKELELETQRILNSVYFKEIELIDDYLDYPYVSVEKIHKRMSEIEVELVKHQDSIDSFSSLFEPVIQDCYNKLLMELATDSIKHKIANTRSFFYFSGWVSIAEKALIEETLKQKYGEGIIITFREIEEVDEHFIPPTKLKNPWLLKPFEFLVQMYGTPSYDEVDPTFFLGITYMFLFGAMFGDLGQGLVLLLGGIFLSKKFPNQMGAQILSRLGMSSMIFGFFYDSFFGYEHVISGIAGDMIGHASAEKIFMRPIENINPILMMSIAIGVFLLLISFGYSIFNKLKRKDIQEGYFGRNGIAGLTLYILLILYALNVFLPAFEMPVLLLRLGIGIAVACIVFREPATNLILKHRPLYHESPSEYYVESGFDILETFLSLLSNSVSFIRVGAFALNHVGLFIAFQTMASIIGGVTGNVGMFILGNLMVIFLEGLIVFIQGLRLVYYEMFSKYYTGEGIEFNAVKLE